MTNKPAGEKKPRVWALWMSIAIQHVVFLPEIFLPPPGRLLFRSTWVMWVPILILWLSYLAAPWVYERPWSRLGILRSYARAGWLFVVASLAWTEAYFRFSQKDGMPVSETRIQAYHQYVIENLKSLAEPAKPPEKSP